MIKKDSGLRKMNIGASFLVAPINTCHDKKLNQALNTNKEAVTRKLDSLMSYYIQKEEKKIKGLSEELQAQKRKNRPPEVKRIEGMMNDIKTNYQGSKVNGREVRVPHDTIVSKIQKQSPSNVRLRRRSSAGAPILDPEEQREIQEQVLSTLKLSGTVGGSESLFVNSKTTLTPNATHIKKELTKQSKMAEENMSMYMNLKTTQNLSRPLETKTSVMKSSFSIDRLDRELSPKRNMPPIIKKKEKPPEQEQPPATQKDLAKSQKSGMTVTEDEGGIQKPLYKDCNTIEEFLFKLDQDTGSEGDDVASLDNERLPGTCKSQYAMKFRLDTDKSIENFIM